MARERRSSLVIAVVFCLKLPIIVEVARFYQALSEEKKAEFIAMISEPLSADALEMIPKRTCDDPCKNCEMM